MEILLFKFNSASAKGNSGEENLSSLMHPIEYLCGSESFVNIQRNEEE